jgi:peptidase E
MRKYILLGGYPYKGEGGGKAFCEEIVKGLKAPAKILLCYFARPEDEWQHVYVEDQAFFKRHLENFELDFQFAEVSKFKEQIDWTDVLYFKGGTTELLMERLHLCDGWEKLLDDKTIVGSSAGADLLSAYHYNIDNLKLEEGLGLVRAKTIPHYQSDYNAPNVDWDKARGELEAWKEDLPVYLLKEGEFVVIHVANSAF